MTDPSPERRHLDPSTASTAALYDTLNAVVSPRAIAWVSTRTRDGGDNLAPHSWTTVASLDPPVVLFTSAAEKDTVRNVRDTGEFVLNAAPERLLEAVNATGAALRPDVSEFGVAGVTPVPAEVVDVARVAESPAALECRVVGLRSFGASTVVYGQVVHVSVDADACGEDGLADAVLLAPLARLDGSRYTGLGEVRELARGEADADGTGLL